METPGKNHQEPTSAENILLGLNKVFPIIKHLYGVRKIGIFGKFARREIEDAEHIELLVEFSKGFESYRLYLDLMQYLSEQLKTRVYLVTSRVYQEGERPDKLETSDIPVPGDPLPVLIGNFEILITKCEGVSVEAFSRNSSLRNFAEDCLEKAALLVREISPDVKISWPGIPWCEIEAIGADIACSGYPADPHMVWYYIHADLPVILGSLHKLAVTGIKSEKP
ncbi:MAG TPA: hypothetical protein VMS89_01480 [Methanoregulaceae archaeon]|nr:hypothetical protein [Methanoregulaceae archaeon]